MLIEANIDYYTDGFLTFDPSKIVGHPDSFFPQGNSEWQDQSKIALDRFFQNVEKKGVEPPEDIIRKKWWLFSEYSPTFIFSSITESNIEISGSISRYYVRFQSNELFDSKTEQIIVAFLKSLKYGEIRSDTQTKDFSQPHPDLKSYWLLPESL